MSPNVPLLMLTYGVIGGFGLGLIYLPAVVAVGYYFESKRALATGISVRMHLMKLNLMKIFSKILFFRSADQVLVLLHSLLWVLCCLKSMDGKVPI